MKKITDLKKKTGETELQYIWRLGSAKDSGALDITWPNLTDLFNKELRDETETWTESAYRKKFQQAKAFYEEVFSKMESDEYNKELMVQKRELERAKIAFRDERNAWQKQNYIDTRVNEKLNILEEKLLNIGKMEFSNVNNIGFKDSGNDLLVILSDLHIGQCFSSTFGEYNSEIAKLRLEKYLSQILEISKRHDSEKCFVSVQGDLISGSIHKAIAITNRENVIDQVKVAAELISSFCHELSKHFSEVVISNVSGNHSRIDRKEDSLHDERLDDLIGWILEKLLLNVNNIKMLHNNIDTGISCISIRGKDYIGVHGDFDSFNKSGVSNLVMLLGYVPYAVTMGHMHTCAVDECNGVKMIRGGSLAGSGDSYTIEKRLSGKPSQMVCICDKYGVKAYYPIELI
ncbi:hypothetical protein [Clostridium sp. HBUAS56010]|uniref:hypothetical protein n=1 Tax=Clostridium sp. HBUAS56010 TaxID=2571127 RepID=UPI001FA9AC98|nr:hypothetical protein [Clostridium sp. HBUAS56010]